MKHLFSTQGRGALYFHPPLQTSQSPLRLRVRIRLSERSKIHDRPGHISRKIPLHPRRAVAYSAPIFCPEGTPPRCPDAMISTLIQTTHTSMASKPAKKSTAPAKSAKSKSVKYIYTWGAAKADGDGSMKALLGGKGANLAEMTRIGLPVPPGFTITTDVCTYYYANKRTYPATLQSEMEKGVANMEKIMGCKFGATTGMPLLVAVRSGARDSMPGMMDTILNLGLNDQTVLALVAATKNERFAWDCYRRFIQMYGDVVMGVQKRAGEDHDPFESVIEHLKEEHHEEQVDDAHLTVADYKELVVRFKKLVKERTGKAFPNDAWEQLRGAAGAVFGSWMNDRAIVYRRKYNIPTEWGTAVNVQAMVYGNTGETSGSGVAFTRNPANGVNEFYGEFLINAQGEDVVAGVRTPEPVSELKKQMPKSYAELMKVRQILEKHFKDVQDIEFTVQEGKLFMLQTRNGKRTAAAALKFSMDMVKEGLIDWETAILRNPADQLEQLLAPDFDLAEIKKAKILASGLPAGPGAASGKIYLNADRAAAAAEKGEKVLLVRNETSPEDLRGMIAAEGILTAKGGVSSHAALVARQMGKVCVAGAGDIEIDYHKGVLKCKGVTLKEGDSISINGTTGEVFHGKIDTADSELKQVLVGKTLKPKDSKVFQYYDFIMKLADKYRTLGLRTNADQPDQVLNAVAFGAEGIGLCRTEHMFFEGDRIIAVRQMILAKSEDARKSALAKLLPYQQKDFEGIFRALDGLPACVRLLDPPLHEFLPQSDNKKGQEEVAKQLGTTVAEVAKMVNELHEFNPMLGFRGCRLGIIRPEITEMQARAIFQAAVTVLKEGVSLRLRWDHPAAANQPSSGRARMGTSCRPCPKISRYATLWLKSSRVMPPMAQSSASDRPLKRLITIAAMTSAKAPA